MLGVGLEAHIPEVAEAAADFQSSQPLRLELPGPLQGTDGHLKLGNWR